MCLSHAKYAFYSADASNSYVFVLLIFKTVALLFGSGAFSGAPGVNISTHRI